MVYYFKVEAEQMFTIVVKDKEQLYPLKRQQSVEYIEYGCASYVESCYAYTNTIHHTHVHTHPHTYTPMQ